MRFLAVSAIVRTMSLICLNKWFFYVFILFYVGGIIIIFIYVISLLNTEKFLLIDASSNKVLIMIILTIVTLDDLNWRDIKLFLVNIYKPFEQTSPIFLALVLLVVLITVVKLCDTWKGSLKSKINE